MSSRQYLPQTRPGASQAVPGSAPARVLVTGGCGFLGRSWVARLLASGAEVVVLDDFSTGLPEQLPRHPALEVRQGSVLDRSALRAAAAGVTRIVHLAAVVGMRVATREPERAYRVSVEGTQRLLAETPGVPALLVSSSAVYGRTHACATSEATVLPDSVAMDCDGGQLGYATGKLHMERVGLAAASTGRPVAILRPFNVVGPGQSSAYGAVLPRFVSSALAGEALRIHDDGQQTRAFSDIETFLDCAEHVACSAALRVEHEPSERIFNIGCPTPTSVLDLARAVLAASGSRSEIEFVPYDRDYPGHADVRARVPDTTRLERSFGPVGWPALSSVVERTVAAARDVERTPRGSASERLAVGS